MAVGSLGVMSSCIVDPVSWHFLESASRNVFVGIIDGMPFADLLYWYEDRNLSAEADLGR